MPYFTGADEAVAVVGGGPAGLRAAEVLAESGCRVALYEGKPSVGRKFLVAGRGGLNLTHSEDLAKFVGKYEDELGRWERLLADFGPAELRAWAAGLGVETYVGTSGRVFPRGQQAAALLRRWVGKLRESGVAFHVNQRLHRLAREPGGGWRLGFRETRAGEQTQASARAIVLALGGASWPQTGSDGAWPEILRGLGIPVAAWQPANCGFEVAWSREFLAAAEGKPIKNITVTAGGRTVPGELLVTRYGLEGGALYQLGRELRRRQPAEIVIDLKPGASEEQLFQRLPERVRQTPNWQGLARDWRLGEAAAALLQFHEPASNPQGQTLAMRAKKFSVALRGPRPIAEAISSAGGIVWRALDESLMVTEHPGLFVAGEMVDWEAPTGGYLLQGCFATGTRAGRAAGAWVKEKDHSAASSGPR